MIATMERSAPALPHPLELTTSNILKYHILKDKEKAVN
jgi:hypothetical protein